MVKEEAGVVVYRSSIANGYRPYLRRSKNASDVYRKRSLEDSGVGRLFVLGFFGISYHMGGGLYQYGADSGQGSCVSGGISGQLPHLCDLSGEL